MKVTAGQIKAFRRVLARASEDNSVFAEDQVDPLAIAECAAHEADIETCREILRSWEAQAQTNVVPLRVWNAKVEWNSDARYDFSTEEGDSIIMDLRGSRLEEGDKIVIHEAPRGEGLTATLLEREEHPVLIRIYIPERA